MSIPVIAFFNNKGGVGKTSIVYHLGWMFADRHLRVMVADLRSSEQPYSRFPG